LKFAKSMFDACMLLKARLVAPKS